MKARESHMENSVLKCSRLVMNPFDYRSSAKLGTTKCPGETK